MQLRRSKYMSNLGFTLIELLITIVILGLLASIVAPEMFGKVGTAQKKTAASQMQSFETAINTYRLDVGDFPENLSELRQSSKKNWDGPYLPKSVPLDPWGNPYIYRVPGDNDNPFYLASLGKDGKPGGEKDAEDIVHKW